MIVWGCSIYCEGRHCGASRNVVAVLGGHINNYVRSLLILADLRAYRRMLSASSSKHKLPFISSEIKNINVISFPCPLLSGLHIVFKSLTIL